MSCGKTINARGFTLVEVMVALFVVAVALPALMFQLSSQLGSAADLQERTLASWVAQDQLAMHRLQSAGNGTGDRQGERQLAGREWSWLLSIEATPVPGMVRQTLRVYPDVMARQQLRDALIELTVYARTEAANEGR